MASFLICSALLVAILGGSQASAQPFNAPFQPQVRRRWPRCAQRMPAAASHANWQSLARYRVPERFRDAKFGIFIHWGVYSVPAFGNEWYSRNMYVQGTPAFAHEVATYGPQTTFGYKDFIPMFRGEYRVFVELHPQRRAAET